MQLYAAIIEDAAVAAMKHVATDRARVTRPSDYRPVASVQEGAPEGYIALHYFRAPDGAAANRYFRELVERGCPGDISVVGDAGRNAGDPGKLWRWRGDVHHLTDRQGDFGLPPHTAKQLACDPHFKKITTILGQHCGTYHRLPKQDGVARVPAHQMQGIRQSFRHAEHEVTILALLLAAAIDAMDDAYRAFGEPASRCFRLAVGEPEPTEQTPPESPPAGGRRRSK